MTNDHFEPFGCFVAELQPQTPRAVFVAVVVAAAAVVVVVVVVVEVVDAVAVRAGVDFADAVVARAVVVCWPAGRLKRLLEQRSWPTI